MSEGLDPRLAERLGRIADPVGGDDWLDVRRRAALLETRRPRRALLVALAATLALGALIAVPALGLGDRLLDLLSLSESEQEVPAPSGTTPPVPYVFGNGLFGLGEEPRTLSRPVFAPLLGLSESLALLSPDGRLLAYHAWEERTPVLRMYELDSGDDRVLARGAQSAAWRSDGALAFWQAERPRYRERRPYLGRIVLRSADGRLQVWTPRAGPYAVSGWAGDTLLVTARSCLICPTALPAPGVYAASGPGRLRPLGLSHLVAVSQDGRLALGGYAPVPGQDSPSSLVRVVEVATGRIVVQLDLRKAGDAGIPRRWLAAGLGKGSWQADRIVSVASLGHESSLVILRFRSDELSVEQLLRLGAGSLPGDPFFSVPRFLGEDGRRVHASEDAIARDGHRLTAFLTCDRVTLRCLRGKPTPARRWLTVVESSG